MDHFYAYHQMEDALIGAIQQWVDKYNVLQVESTSSIPSGSEN